MVTREGESDDVILVGAHYDSAGTHGVDDNGSGVAVVLENALRMADEPTFYTIRYVFFGSEEIGLCGSREYVRSLSESEKEHIVLMINADSILAGDHLYLYGEKVKAYLRRGARELPGVDVYPNQLVGYGAFCTFNIK